MSEPSAIKFPVADEFLRLLKLFEECEAEITSAELYTDLTPWRNNIRVSGVFDDDEIVEVEIRVRKKEG